MGKQNKNHSTSNNNKAVPNDKRACTHNGSKQRPWISYLTLWNLWKFLLGKFKFLNHNIEYTCKKL